MYNEELKNEYLSVAPDSEKIAATQVFNRIETYEEMFGQDVSQMGYENLALTVAGISTGNSQTITSRRNTIGKYINWCIAHQKTTITENLTPLLPKIHNMNVLSTRWVTSAKQINEIFQMAGVFYADAGTHHSFSLWQMCILLAWDGFEAEDMWNLRADEVDLVNHTAVKNGAAIPLSTETVDVLRFVSQLSGIVSSRLGVLPQKPRPEFVLFYPESVKKFNFLCVNSSIKLRNEYEKNTGEIVGITISRAHESGMFNRMLQKEMQGAEAVEIRKELETNFNARKKYTFDNRLRDYEAWKNLKEESEKIY